MRSSHLGQNVSFLRPITSSTFQAALWLPCCQGLYRTGGRRILCGRCGLLSGCSSSEESVMSSLASSWSWLASGELLLSLRWDSVSTASNAVVMPLLSLPAEEVSPPGAMPLLERVAGNNVNGGSSQSEVSLSVLPMESWFGLSRHRTCLINNK